MTGSESTGAERMRRLRDKKTSQCDTDVTGQLHIGDVEIEKEIEIEIDKEKDNKYICPEMNSGQPQPKVETGPAAESRTKVEIGPSCSQAELKVEIGPAQADVFIKLPMNDGTDYLVTKDYVQKLKELYPAVDVEQELRNMWGWLDSNPKNRKTPKGMKRFITGWIAREQDRAPRVGSKQNKAAQNRFNNFTQREYDFEKLEKDLLQV